MLADTLPMVILGTAVLYGYPRAARMLLPALFLVPGLGVWLVGRAGSHIGASGLALGMMFLVFTIGVMRWDRRAIGLALIVFLLYGEMVSGVVPGDPGVSLEFHLAGTSVGVVLALLLRDLDPPPLAKRYSWEQEAELRVEDATPWPVRVHGDFSRYGALPFTARGWSAHVAGRAQVGETGMDIDALRGTLGDPAPPDGLSAPVRALWHLARKQWDVAHAVVQEEGDADSAWVHAHLHRVEGDLSNARYWYRKAQRPESRQSLEQEWVAIVETLLGR